MKIEGFDHIHIAVRNLEEASKFFSDILGTKFDKPIIAPGIRSRIDSLGLELIQPTVSDSALARFIEKCGEGVCGVSLKVADIEAATAELKAKGLRPVGKIELGRLREIQFHPQDTHGVMIELCEYEEVHGASLAARSTE